MIGGENPYVGDLRDAAEIVSARKTVELSSVAPGDSLEVVAGETFRFTRIVDQDSAAANLFSVVSDRRFPETEAVQIQGTTLGGSAILTGKVVEGGQLEMNIESVSMPDPDAVLEEDGYNKWMKRLEERKYTTPEIAKVTLHKMPAKAE